MVVPSSCGEWEKLSQQMAPAFELASAALMLL
jgi:hypothetical protein